MTETPNADPRPIASANPRGRSVPVAASLLLALAALGCGRGDGPASGPEEGSAVPVLVVEVMSSTVRATVSATGTLRSPRQVEIRSEATGLVKAVPLEEGEAVREGDRLVTLERVKLERELEARRAALEAAKARAVLADRVHERVATLHRRGSASTEELDRAAAGLRQSRADAERIAAEIQLAEERLEDATIVAPAAGRLAERLVDPGDFVDVGDPVAVLYAVDPLEIAFAVPERAMDRVALGQRVEVRVTALPERNLQGEVTFVSPAVDEATRAFLVKARIDNPDGLLKPGIFATATVVTERREDVAVVPEEALVSTRTGPIVFVVENDTASRREVEIGLREPGRVEVRRGLEVGETVVREGQMGLADGTPVRVVETGGEAGAGSGPTG